MFNNHLYYIYSSYSFFNEYYIYSYSFLMTKHMLNDAKYMYSNYIYLVGGFNHIENMSQMGEFFPIYGQIKVMFQITNQYILKINHY